MDFIMKAFIFECILLIGLVSADSTFAVEEDAIRYIDDLIAEDAMKINMRSRAIAAPQGKLECVDDMKYCTYFETQGFCKHASYNEFMQKHCKETCGFCEKPKPTPIPVVRNCRDRSVFCNVWRQYCPRRTPYIKRNCQKTCNFCTSDKRKLKPKNELYTGPCGVPAVRIQDSKKAIKIVGGQDAEYGAIPWQASLFYYGTFKCGAVVFHNQHILTAAHCFKGIRNLNPVSFTVYLGKHYKFPENKDEGQMKYAIDNILIHPNYNRTNDDNDIAIIQLKEKIKFNRYIRPICLPKQNEMLLKGTPAIVSGWGDTKGGNSNEILQFVDVYIQNNDECNMGMSQFTNKIDEVNENMVCAGHTRGTKDSCNGDSGGPLVIKSANGSLSLAGLVSWGYGCGHAYRPGVYTRIPNYVDWIHNNLFNANKIPIQVEWERGDRSTNHEEPDTGFAEILINTLQSGSNNDSESNARNFQSDTETESYDRSRNLPSFP